MSSPFLGRPPAQVVAISHTQTWALPSSISELPVSSASSAVLMMARLPAPFASALLLQLPVRHWLTLVGFLFLNLHSLSFLSPLGHPSHPTALVRMNSLVILPCRFKYPSPPCLCPFHWPNPTCPLPELKIISSLLPLPVNHPHLCWHFWCLRMWVVVSQCLEWNTGSELFSFADL